LNDVVTKLADYHHYEVPLYVIVDREDENSPLRLLGYERTPRRYRPIPLEDDGRLWLPPVGVYLGVRDNRVVVHDGVTDEELGDYSAVSRALEEAQARADAETQRADAERQRADAERQRGDAEKQRAEAAEARVRQLEAELRARP
jgi:hypothetical protein